MYPVLFTTANISTQCLTNLGLENINMPFLWAEQKYSLIRATKTLPQKCPRIRRVWSEILHPRTGIGMLTNV
jgi:hypothetical protein